MMKNFADQKKKDDEVVKSTSCLISNKPFKMYLSSIYSVEFK